MTHKMTRQGVRDLGNSKPKLAEEPPMAAPCRHQWRTDQYGLTECKTCGEIKDANVRNL